VVICALLFGVSLILVILTFKKGAGTLFPLPQESSWFGHGSAPQSLARVRDDALFGGTPFMLAKRIHEQGWLAMICLYAAGIHVFVMLFPRAMLRKSWVIVSFSESQTHARAALLVLILLLLADWTVASGPALDAFCLASWGLISALWAMPLSYAQREYRMHQI
jgi:hypothetical protein